MFEVTDTETPQPQIDPNVPFESTAPQVHSGIVG